jgi:excisionase family DNA binding protein
MKAPEPFQSAGSSPPLAAAAVRLRGRPGRPRRHPANGQSTGKVLPQVRDNAAPVDRPLVPQATVPRLLDVEAAARYLGISSWTVRAMVDAGTLRPVRLPLDGGRELRRLLFDQLDLDRVIEAGKA